MTTDDGRRIADDGGRIADDGRRIADDGGRIADDGGRIADDGRRTTDRRRWATCVRPKHSPGMHLCGIDTIELRMLRPYTGGDRDGRRWSVVGGRSPFLHLITPWRCMDAAPLLNTS